MENTAAQAIFGLSALNMDLIDTNVKVLFKEDPSTLYSGAVEFSGDDFVNITSNVLSPLGININVATHPTYEYISSIYLNGRSANTGDTPNTQQYGSSAAQAVFRSCKWLERNKKL